MEFYSRAARSKTILVGAVALGATLGLPVLATSGKTPVPAADAQTAAHVLNRLTFGARPGDLAHVEKIGIAAYVDEQLHPDRIDDSALQAHLATFDTLNLSTRDLADKYFLPAAELRRAAQRQNPNTTSAATAQAPVPDPNGDQMMMDAPAAAPENAPAAVPPEVRQAQAAAQNVMNELMQAKVLRATFSDRQLQEVLVDFWLNHFNVFVGKGQVRLYLPEYERDVIRPHVLGRFRDLLGAVAHSPAMLFYLDNWQSSTPNPTAYLSPELEARLNNPRLPPGQRAALMARIQQQRGQNRAEHGLNENYAREIMELHTLGVDGGYTQQDVTELARILTGWTIDRPQQGGGFIFRPQMHDMATKTFLGVTFKPEGESEGERALDMLAKHPSTAHHIAFELAQRFVADDPPPALVDRAAKTFLDTDGDLREVVRTIVTSPEFFAPAADRAKVKTPLEFVVSAVRATDANVQNAMPMVVELRNLGMPLYGCQPPTGYSMTADAWVNTGALLTRMNFAIQLLQGGRITAQATAGPNGRIPAGARAQGRGQGAGRGAFGAGPIQVDLPALAPDTSETTRTDLIDTILAGQASDATRHTLARAETPANLVALTLGSPEFQRR